MNAIDIIGAVMQTGVSPAAGNRIGSILGKITGGGAPTASQDGAVGGGVFDMLSKAAGAMLGGGSGCTRRSACPESPARIGRSGDCPVGFREIST